MIYKYYSKNVMHGFLNPFLKNSRSPIGYVGSNSLHFKIFAPVECARDYLIYITDFTYSM